MKLTLRKNHGAYVLDSGATLHTHWTMRFGRIQTAEGTWPVGVDDVRRPGVTTGPGAGPVVRLQTRQVILPGMTEPAKWQPSRTFGSYKGVLARGSGSIIVRQAVLPGSAARIIVTGSWLHLDLIALTACFAVMARRRRDHLIALRVASATSHGPV